MQHALPGRLRLRAPEVYRRADVAEQIVRRAGSVVGVLAVKVDTKTATMLVRFAPETRIDSIADAIADALSEAGTEAIVPVSERAAPRPRAPPAGGRGRGSCAAT